jgi:hypothetical protein
MTWCLVKYRDNSIFLCSYVALLRMFGRDIGPEYYVKICVQQNMNYVSMLLGMSCIKSLPCLKLQGQYKNTKASSKEDKPLCVEMSELLPVLNRPTLWKCFL